MISNPWCITASLLLASTSGFTSYSNNLKTAFKYVNQDVVRKNSELAAFSVKASTLEEDLTQEEATIVRVFRQCGPSVAYVTSVSIPPPTSTTARSNSNRSSRRNKRQNQNENKSKSETSPDKTPGARSLGTGSGFVVEDSGYIVTNYHVIQRAYQLNQSLKQIRNNSNASLNSLSLPDTTNTFIRNSWNVTSKILGLDYLNNEKYTPAQVYVRINSATKYEKAEIVGVKPELDMAVLRITSSHNNTSTTTYPSVKVGSSSELLVGQRVVAIGNPFGLDQTVTSGVVSALNREVTGVAGNKIPNCIQTDAAINPGNSGGPLLNSRGELIGVNTAIISTSGSNAGIGFAIPGDAVAKAMRIIIDKDRRERQGSKSNMGYLGVSLASDSMTNAIWRKSGNSTDLNGVLVLGVKSQSPGEEGGLLPLQVENGKVVQTGDVIVAINGKEVTNGIQEVQDDFRTRRNGEKLFLTVENDKTRRVVYVTLGGFP